MTVRNTSMLALFAALALGHASAETPPKAAPKHAIPTRHSGPLRLVPTIVATYPHDSRAFTQGLLLDGVTLYESTGLRGRSSLRAVDLASGNVRRQHDLPATLFGEGLARVEDHLIQLTWTSGVARVYSINDFSLVTEHRYQGQGWGLCFDGELLAMSDGSHQIQFRDPTTFAVARTLEVYDKERRVSQLNELECVGKHIYANVWGTWRIVRIDKYSGRIDAIIDASGLLAADEKAALPGGAVLNGIAYDETTDTLLLTGKLWPAIYRVRLQHPAPDRGRPSRRPTDS